MKKIICRNPFFYCDIGLDGNVYACCNKWCNFYSLGNILNDDLTEIFHGEKIQEFIKQFTDQNFKYCRTDICIGSKKIEESAYPRLFQEYLANKKREMRLNFDTSCNLSCIFCRHNFSMANENELTSVQKLIDRIKTFLPEIDKNHWVISLNGQGEVFVSKPYLDLIRHITENYKNIKFQIITNGILCSEEMLKSLNIENRIQAIEISVHAYTEKTYNKLIKGGKFNILKKNLQYVSELKKQNKINHFQMNFAINSINYKEMVDFTKWSLQLEAEPCFLPLLILEPKQREEFDKLNVADKNHPKYNDFVKILNELSQYKDNMLMPENFWEMKENEIISSSQAITNIKKTLAFEFYKLTL
ncbi:MAG: radical SAM protein [Candidatus Gastranaerophilales bacterium]|nr:radical SAM protein [Candidatus Gastranaerophilales bacterium]